LDTALFSEYPEDDGGKLIRNVGNYLLYNNLHGVILYKTEIAINTAMRTPNFECKPRINEV
jgi:hypothetical protein